MTQNGTGFNALVTTRYGPMVVNRHDSHVGKSILAYGEYSEAEAETFRRFLKPGDVACEVGANYGTLTVPLALAVAPGGFVLAIEPQRLAYQLLCANIALASLDHVYAKQVAFGAQEGMVTVPMLDPDVENNVGGLRLGGNPHAQREGETVAVLTLDQAWAGARLDFLKLDVEDMEVDVLRGGIQTVMTHKPVIVAEALDSRACIRLRDFLTPLGYAVWLQQPLLYNPNNFAGNPVNHWPGIVSPNLLCVHTSQTERMAIVEDMHLVPVTPA